MILVYQKFDISKIKPHLMVYGDLSGACENCGQVDLKLNQTQCPKCQTVFKYVAFRNIKTHIPKLYKLAEERPSLVVIDFDDYKRNLAQIKAREFFK